MPARVMPSNAAPNYMNPVGNHDDATGKKTQMAELTVCISLASLFDFEKTGFISQENWQKGMTTLMMEELGLDPKIWERLVGMHGSRDAGKGRLDDAQPRIITQAKATLLLGPKNFSHSVKATRSH